MIKKEHREIFNSINWDKIRSYKKYMNFTKEGNFSRAKTFEKALALESNGVWYGYNPNCGYDVKINELKIECKMSNKSKISKDTLKVGITNGDSSRKVEKFVADYYVYWDMSDDSFYVFISDLLNVDKKFVVLKSTTRTDIPVDNLTKMSYLIEEDLEPFCEETLALITILRDHPNFDRICDEIQMYLGKI